MVSAIYQDIRRQSQILPTPVGVVASWLEMKLLLKTPPVILVAHVGVSA